jgi:uncharacterized membrane protein
MSPVHSLALLIEMAGSIAVAVFAAIAALALLRGRGPETARLLLAEGVILALSLKTAATLLKTLDLPTWDRIAAFAVILVLRTVLKRVFVAEQRRLSGSH